MGKRKRLPQWFQFLSGPTHGSTLPGSLCGLCAQSGVIDTTGIRTPAGYEVGGRFYCICPNGRTLKRNLARGVFSSRTARKEAGGGE